MIIFNEKPAFDPGASVSGFGRVSIAKDPKHDTEAKVPPIQCFNLSTFKKIIRSEHPTS